MIEARVDLQHLDRIRCKVLDQSRSQLILLFRMAQLTVSALSERIHLVALCSYHIRSSASYSQLQLQLQLQSGGVARSYQ